MNVTTAAKRRFRKGGWCAGVALLLGGALAACSSDDATPTAGSAMSTSPSPDGTTGTPAPSAPGPSVTDSSRAPAHGGRLVVAVDAEAQGFDPAMPLGAGGLTYTTAFFDPLMAATDDGQIVPYLAESMVPNADFSSWTMTLRPGITFHDGQPLTADAVRLNMEHQLASPTGVYPGFQGVTVVDDLTLTFDLAMPWVRFPANLTTTLGLIAAPSMLADPEGASHPVGTGPFVFQEWLPNQRVVATRNPDYWQPGLPYLDEVEFRPITEFDSRLSALQTGEVDVMYAFGGDALQATTDLGDAVQSHVVEEGANLENFVLLNNAVAPFDNIHARRALAYATDRDQLNEVLHRGLAQPATGPFSGEDQYAVPQNVPTFDPDRAAEEVAAYTAATGEQLRFELSAPSTAKGLQEAQLLQDIWGRAGIEVEIRQVEEALAIQNVLLGDYQAMPMAWDSYPDPDQETVFWTSMASAPVGQFSLNFARFDNSRVDELMGQARGTVDDAARRALYEEVAQIMIDEVPRVYLYRPPSVLAAAPDVVGLGSFPLAEGEGVEFVQGMIRVTYLARAE